MRGVTFYHVILWNVATRTGLYTRHQSETEAGGMGSRFSLPGVNGVSPMRLP